MNVSGFLRSAVGVQRQLQRGYAFKSDLKIKWVRPEKISCIRPEKSGDLAKLPPVSPSEIIPDFRNSKELESADPTVRSLYQLDYNPKIHTAKFQREQLVQQVQRHSQDYGSMEAKLAKMTANIRRFQEHMEKFPRDKRIKVILKETIDKRKKYLKYLRRWDYKRFEWVLEKLDLVYKPPPAEFHWVTRKESLQKLTDAYCEEIKEQRLEEYRKKLEAQKLPFLEDALQKLAEARKQCEAAKEDPKEIDAMIEEFTEKLKQVKLEQEQSLLTQENVVEEKF